MGLQAFVKDDARLVGTRSPEIYQRCSREFAGLFGAFAFFWWIVARPLQLCLGKLEPIFPYRLIARLHLPAIEINRAVIHTHSLMKKDDFRSDRISTDGRSLMQTHDIFVFLSCTR